MDIRFTFAISSYDHVRDVVDGRIPIEGAEPLFIQLPIPEMFGRFVGSGDWDVSEMSFAQYGTMRASGDDRIVGIPVFPSRMYRHTAIYVRADRIKAPQDLPGSRVGIPTWANSAGVWARGMLSDMHGIQPADVTWYRGGIDRPGRPQHLTPAHLPDGVRIVPVADRSLEEMLWTGDLDAIIVPSPPASIEASAASGGLVRWLYDDPWTAERQYLEKTGCLPIMHVVGIRRGFYDREPGLAGRIYQALNLAKQRYFDRLDDAAVSRVPLPWIGEHLESLAAILGNQIWPYGVEPNRPTLQTYLRYIRDQGLIADQVDPADLFPEWVATAAR